MSLVIWSFLAVFVLLLLQVPVGFGLGIVGVAGFAWMTDLDAAFSLLALTTTETVLNYNMAVLPLFVLMGALMTHSRMADELYQASHAFLGHRRGGVAMATIMACGGFSAVSGSALACAATMTPIAVPMMRKYGYARGFAAGTVAAGSTLDILIPPSTIMVLYTLFTEVSLEKLMMAGILPGAITILLYLAAIFAVTSIWPHLGPAGERSDWATRFRATRRILPLVILFVAVLGGIYVGIFTPTEAAGVGATAAFLASIASRRLSLAKLWPVLVDTVCTTVVLFIVLIGAILFSKFMTISGASRSLEEWVGGLHLGAFNLLLLIIALYVVLGCIIEGTAMVVLTIPVFFPLIMQAGIDPIFFGIIVVIMGGIGIIHPPMGILLYLVRALIPGSTNMEIFKGVIPFLVADAARIALFLAFPTLVLLLPSMMK